jgi:Domain of unknown function (DUF4345)
LIAPATERRLLQIAVLAGACVPVSAGLLGMIEGAGMVPGETVGGVSLDSHVRYLSGILFAIGLAFWAFVPAIERRGSGFVLLGALVFIGGLARLAGLLHATPDMPMRFALVMELLVTPLLCLWQRRVARHHARE